MRIESNLCAQDEKTAFQAQCVHQHNILRRFHGADPLKISQRLTEEAQEHADQLVSCRMDATQASEHTVCHVIARSISAEEITDMWSSESSKVNFCNPVIDDLTSRFTQMIWKGSREIGVGIGRGSNGHFYVVAAYSPVGNDPHVAKLNLSPPRNW